jgi:phenylalanyl-tRNA synthetase beta chain
MKIIPSWLREFVDIPVDDRKLAEDLTLAGISVESIEGEGERAVFDIDFTPNRVDAMNHYGVARDCSAIYDSPLKTISSVIPSGDARERSERVSQSRDLVFPIEIEDPKGCARYTAQVVRNVKVGPSPEKIVQRLALLDSRPISNVADASNYTLQEIGHPTHCFDLDTLEGGKIIVRRARKGEKLKTLDGVDHELHPDDLVIADAVKPVALAGVMGGYDTMITDRTRHVLIESAWFDPASIRKTARRHAMHTDASHRFERGADIGITPTACVRVAELILQTAGGALEGSQIDPYPRKLSRPTLTLRHSEVRRILGADIPDTDVSRILRRLGFVLTVGASAPTSKEIAPPVGRGGTHAAIAEEVSAYTVTVPSWRLDVEREIDLIEEIARIYGYDNFENSLPGFVGGVIERPEERQQQTVRESLLGLGYNEAISLSFISREDASAFSNVDIVEIANPISETAAVMRTSMASSMLAMIGYNLNRGNANVRLFEIGNIYEKTGERTLEHLRLCFGATGAAVEANVHQPGRPYTFYDLKGDVETLLSEFAYGAVYFDTHSGDYFHPGRSARAVVDGKTVARFGQLHPRVAAERKLKQEVFLAELDLERLFEHSLRKPRYQLISRYPEVDRDFSFLFDDAITFDRIRGTINALRIAELTRLEPVEIFRGGSVPKGKYSLLLRAAFQSVGRTLRDDEVSLWSQQIVKTLEALGGQQRA